MFFANIFNSVIFFSTMVFVESCDMPSSKIIKVEDLRYELKNNNNIDTLFLESGYITEVITIEKKSQKNLVILPLEEGSVTITGEGTLLIKNTSNLTMQGFLFEKTKRHAILLDNSSNVHLLQNYFYMCGNSPTVGSIIRLRNSSHDNHIRNNTFDDNRSIGITLSTATTADKHNVRNKIYQNVFINVKRVKTAYPNSEGNGMECIQVGGSDPASRWWEMQTEIYDNVFQNIFGDGVEIISVKTSDNKIFDNTFLDNHSGITIRYGNNTLVKNNVFLNTARGIRIYGRGHKILNNIIVGGDVGIIMPAANIQSDNAQEGTNLYYQSDSIKISGNLFSGQRLETISLGDGKNQKRSFTPKNVTFDNNKVVVKEKHNFIHDTEQNVSELSFKDNNEVLYEPLEKISRARIGANSMQKNKYQPPQISIDGQLIDVKDFTDTHSGARWKKPIVH